MTTQVRVRTGHWGRHARRALDLVRRGYVVELVAGREVVGYMTPPRLPITKAIIDQAVRRSPPGQADDLRHMLEGMATSGMWSYEPHTALFVTDPPAPTFPAAAETEAGEDNE